MKKQRRAPFLLFAAAIITMMASVSAYATEQDLFANILYPFMRNNCIKCHGEQAIYPVGPAHTHSNVNTAFKTFSKFIDHNDFANSRFLKFASNKHFCRDHDTNCDRQDVIVSELGKRFNDFSAKAKTLMKVSGNFGTQIVSDDQDILQNIKMGSSTLTVMVGLKKYSEEYTKVKYVYLSSDSPIDLSMDGIEIRINGQLPPKKTGLENLKRNLRFVKEVHSTRLNPLREPILALKANDRVTIDIINLRDAKIEKSEICMDATKRFSVIKDLKADETLYTLFLAYVFGTSDGRNTLGEETLCDQLMLTLNSENLSQSILLQQMISPLKKSTLALAQKWLTKPSAAVEEEPRLNIESIQAQFNSTCFNLSDKTTQCFGDMFGTNLQIIPAKQNVRKFSVGTYAWGYLDSNGNIHFDGTNTNDTFPKVPFANRVYSHPTEVADFQAGYTFSCLLTKSGEVWCGGSNMDGFTLPDGRENFVKISTVPIDRMFVNLRSVFMLTTTGDLYHFGGREMRGVGFRNYADSGQKVRMAQYLELPYKVQNVYVGFNDFCFRSIGNQLHCFSEYSSLFDMFGISEQGLDIGMDFKEIALMSNQVSTCALTQKSELYCSGTYPSGLLNREGRRTSLGFQKIENAPKNIKFMTAGSTHLCLVTMDNLISCAADQPVNAGQRSSDFNTTDRQGRVFYSGAVAAGTTGATLSPYITLPIR